LIAEFGEASETACLIRSWNDAAVFGIANESAENGVPVLVVETVPSGFK
jgi:hypothetical protein